MTPLTREETGEYIAHRLKIAGVTREVFTKPAIRELYKLSRGIPRLINTLSERSLIGAYGANLPLIKKDIVRNAANEVLGKSSHPQKSSMSWVAVGAIAVACVVIALGLWGALLSNGQTLNSANATAVSPNNKSQNSQLPSASQSAQLKTAPNVVQKRSFRGI